MGDPTGFTKFSRVEPTKRPVAERIEHHDEFEVRPDADLVPLITWEGSAQRHRQVVAHPRDVEHEARRTAASDAAFEVVVHGRRLLALELQSVFGELVLELEQRGHSEVRHAQELVLGVFGDVAERHGSITNTYRELETHLCECLIA